MGTYYAIGIVKKFKTQAKHAVLPISPSALEEAVAKRWELDLFDLSHADRILEGTLKPGLFENNIRGFVDKLVEIAPECESVFRFNYEHYGTDIDRYDPQSCRMTIPSPDGQLVAVRVDLAPVFIEGKVLAECFTIEPVLMSWLFRHCNLGNPLVGAVVSSIIG